jgi:hypothetical protein
MYSHLQEGAVVPPGVAVEAAAPIGPPAPGDAPLAEDTAPAAVRRPTPLFSFKSEMARAMQVVADRACERIDAGAGDEETAQVEKIHVRAAAEAAELSKHADEDVSLVNAWYEDQVQRIRTEADRQIDDRRIGLEQSLMHHGSLIEAEIQSVHVAVQGYRASLGEFFGRLAEEQDPSVIARLVGTLPDLPDLDEVRAEARSGAMKGLEQGPAAETPDPADESSANGNGRIWLEREPVPVMDPGAVNQPVSRLSGTAIPVATPVPAAPSASQPSWSPEQSEVDMTASPPEALSPEGNVAVRLIRGSTIWTSLTGDSEGQ